MKMDFGYALNALKEGLRVSRSGWNGKGMWLVKMPAEGWYVDEAFFGEKSGRNFSTVSIILMKTADEKIVPWLASQTDLLADDWGVV
jgi:hypothetical protein